MHASETAKRMVQVAAVKAQVEAITRRLRATVDELEEAVRAMPNGDGDGDGNGNDNGEGPSDG
jgi:hypothetical protein